MKRKLITLITILLIILIGTCIYYFSNYDSKLVDINDIKTDPGYVDVTYNNVDDIVNKDILGILTIEKSQCKRR